MFCLLPCAFLGGDEFDYSVIYRSPESADDKRDRDVVELLRTALDKTVDLYGPYTMVPSGHMNAGRMRVQIVRGDGINVMWTVPSEELETQTIGIHIPVRKGILGYRVLLIRKEDRERFASIRSLDELKELSLGQGMGWDDVKLMKAQGFRVISGSSYEGLFGMLSSGRFDYFSRGLNEAYQEQADRVAALPNLWVEETLLLYYTWPKFFYISGEVPHIAERIERGLEIMIEDGSFDEIFYRYHGPVIERADLKNRRLFRIDNPFLPEVVPLDRKELWYDPLDTNH